MPDKMHKMESGSARPLAETDGSISYLGVELLKAENSQNAPKREAYADYINDRFSLELQKKLAISILQGDPILIEGGTSIGKTTTVKKMCAELGYEVHYVNLNGATDVEDLMGRYIPNHEKKGPNDPEYVFADGKVTSGLRQEDGKIKVIILDEYNSAAPNILIRLHEILDGLERGGEVVLAEDASEHVPVNKTKTKIVALTNPPGRGYLQREPLDPAQLRRWVYQKEVTDLPKEAFEHATRVLFGLESESEPIPQETFLFNRSEGSLTIEALSEIPGIAEINAKYLEFHHGIKNLLQARKVAADQPQLFTFDDREEPKRVVNFVRRFYRGDLTETFQAALRYYYSGKLFSSEDKAKVEELIKHVEYRAPVNTKRKTVEEKETETPSAFEVKSFTRKDGSIMRPGDEATDPRSGRKGRFLGIAKESGELIFEEVEALAKEGESSPLEIAKEIFKDRFYGPERVREVFGISLTVKDIPLIPFSEKELREAGARGERLILRMDVLPDGKPASMQNLGKLLADRYAKADKGVPIYDPEGWKAAEPFFTEELPRSGWALESAEFLPDSTSKNYIEQTKLLREYAESLGILSATDKTEASDTELNKLTELMATDWKAAAESLSKMAVNKKFRRRAVEVLYDLLLIAGDPTDPDHQRLLESTYDWSSSPSAGGHLVLVGRFGAEGVRGSGWLPVFAFGRVGVSFSRSV